MIEMNAETWLREPVREDVADLWRVHEVLYEGQTAFQHIVIARTLLGVTSATRTRRAPSPASWSSTKQS